MMSISSAGPARRARPPLQVIVVWHPRLDPQERKEIVAFLYARICRRPAEPLDFGLGIPLYYRSRSAPGGALPAPVELEEAHATLVAPVLDDEALADQGWCAYLTKLGAQIRAAGTPHRMLPIAISPHFGNLVLPGNPQSIRLVERTGKARRDLLEERMLDLLCRLALAPLSGGKPERVHVFLSHAKAGGGDEIIQEVRGFLDESPVETFYDARDIDPGEDWIARLEESAGRGCLIALQTDPYPTREWCRREVLAAKRAGCAVVTVLALEQGEERSFPYLGNAPTVLWLRSAEPSQRRENARRILVAALREVLRQAYFRRQCESLVRDGLLPGTCVAFGAPPELLTFHYHAATVEPGCGTRLFLYPDPPLGMKERELFAAHSNIRLATPATSSFWSAGGSSDLAPLKGRSIALSIGDPEPDELEQLGLGPEHLMAAMVEISRHLLARGAKLAYGGAPVREFTQALFSLVDAHKNDEEMRFDRIQSYFAAYLAAGINAGYRAKHSQDTDIHDVPCPADAAADLAATAEPNRLRYAQARCLTEMRRTVTAATRARVVLGGKLLGFTGCYPGIAEEVFCSIEANQPIYVVGGYGGCAAAVANVITGGSTGGLDGARQMQDTAYRDWVAYYNGRVPDPALKIDYTALVNRIRAFGLDGLAARNGLSAEENRILLATRHINEITYYLLKGLSAAGI